MQTLKDDDFNTNNVTRAILADLNLHTTCWPLATQISEVSGEPFSLANHTNITWCSPSNQNPWRNQNNSSGQYQKSSNNSYQQQPSSGQSNN